MEKTMNDLGDKVDSAVKSEIESGIQNLKKAMEGDDASEIRRLTETLTQASHKLAESMYQQAGPSGPQQSHDGAEGAWGPAGAGSDDDVVDAEYREVA